MQARKKVIIIGGGFGGLAVAKKLAMDPLVDLMLIDRRNYHLFQPLLYQVAMAGLNPSDIAIPLRRLFSKRSNLQILLAEVSQIDLKHRRILFDDRWENYDYLVLACGSKHFYFNHPEWESVAPGLKTIEQATEIRRRILLAFELADKELNEERKQEFLTFVVVGGGPTGVELAGAIAEMAHRTLYVDYKNVDLKATRVVLVEAGPKILSAFPDRLTLRAKHDLETLGVEVILNQRAGNLSKNGLTIGEKPLRAHTIIWAAGVKPSMISNTVDAEKTIDGRLLVNPDLSIPNFPNAFVVGDQAAVPTSLESAEFLPGLAPVAIQEGQFVGKLIRNELRGKQRKAFKYFDKGIMATIGRAKAVVSSGPLQMTGFFAWLAWALIHITYIVQFKNKFFILLQWIWAYFSFGRGARLIVHKSWQFYSDQKIPISKDD